jgi:hypothetical protein
MVREKKSKVDDVVKLRKILDNSSDPNIKALISSDERALDSVRRRLSGDIFRTKPLSDRFSRTSNSLEPKVTVRPINALSPRLITPLPKYTPSTTLPEFIPISASSPLRPIPSRELPFTTEELYEVEKVDVILPEPTSESSLPEWQPVEETQLGEPPKTQAKSEVDQIPEFEREEIPINSEKAEKIADWETTSPKEEPTITPVQFTAVESTESKLQKLSKKQEREAKKIQKTKEKEAKQLKKLELKKLKRETRDKKREAKRIITEQQDIQQTPETIEFIPIKQKRSAKKPKKKPEDSTEWESYFVEKTLKKPSLKSTCTYKGYTLYKRETGNQREGKKTIHFFSKEKPDNSRPVQLPDGYQISVNKKTGIPYLKKKK